MDKLEDAVDEYDSLFNNRDDMEIDDDSDKNGRNR